MTHRPTESAPTICLATCNKVPDLTEDDRLFREVLAAKGWTVESARWDDPEIRWQHYAAVILRSTWDYHLRIEEFRAWLECCQAAGARLLNPPELVRWNLHKGYLFDLEKEGVRIVPTHLIERGTGCKLGALMAERGWREAVIKPAISATAHRTFRVLRQDAGGAEDRIRAYAADCDLLIQPFLPEIVSQGELSFLFFGNELSHTVLKRARAGDYRVQNDFGGTAERFEPSPELAEQASAIARALPASEPWLYARIDAVELEGTLALMEAELIEPQLFFTVQHPQAAEAMASALERLVRATS